MINLLEIAKKRYWVDEDKDGKSFGVTSSNVIK
jgi:hypothetical protein